MKKLLSVFLMVSMVFVGTEMFAQGKSKIKISNGSAQDLVQQIKENPNAEELYLFRNGLDSIPEEVGMLKNLKELTVSSNRVTYVPPVICTLTNLEKISLKNNNIKQLPAEIGNLKNLTELDLDGNELEELPASIANLTELVELNITGSGPMLVVPNMGNCHNLETLFIDSSTLFDESFSPRSLPRLEVRVLP
ncbi:MAG: leucine-rich repeat domain-containing protein [Bacteroidales bacterium]|nr:leucine-rich repeat domain-containing protein [Bacteroidales bacterium]